VEAHNIRKFKRKKSRRTYQKKDKRKTRKKIYEITDQNKAAIKFLEEKFMDILVRGFVRHHQPQAALL
jgi:DNA-binding PadR family transcriptional regulator